MKKNMNLFGYRKWNLYDNDGDGFIDEEIDMAFDDKDDGVDNDNNGTIDDSHEHSWGENIDNNFEKYKEKINL